MRGGDTPLLTCIDRVLDTTSNRVACEFNGESCTYGELARQVAVLSEEFARHLEVGELLALWLPNSPIFLSASLACLRTGRVLMPLNVEGTLAELVAALAHARCRHLLVSPDAFLDLDPARLFADTDVCTIWSVDGQGLACVWHREDAGKGVVARVDSAALVLHTSGSTGQPKGAILSQQALLETLQGRIEVAAITRHSTAVVASSLAHTVGLYQSLAFLLSGARFVLLESYDMDLLAKSVNALRPSHLIMVVSAFEQLLQHPAISADSFSAIRFAAVGADRVPLSLQQRYHALTGKNLVTTYGMTELSWILVNRQDDPDRSTALGVPAPGIRVRLLDESGAVVRPGCVGEIVARGPKAMSGYLHDEQLTDQTLRQGWVHSGDLAREDAQGVLWYMGRSKDILVLTSGDTVSPVEIEREILVLPGIADCIVAGMPVSRENDECCSEVPWAFVRRSNDGVDSQEIVEHLQGRISGYKVPREFIFLEEFPRGVSGKISRRELGDWAVGVYSG